MSINYERYKFLEFFDHEIIIDEEAQIMEYSVNTDDFIFKITIFAYDDFSSIAVTYQKNNSKLIHLGIKEINRIDNDQTSLRFYQKALFAPVFTVQVKPIILIQGFISLEKNEY